MNAPEPSPTTAPSPEAGLGRRDRRPKQAAPARKPRQPPAPSPQSAWPWPAHAGASAALLYVQVYSEAERALAEDLRRKLMATPANGWMVPPVERGAALEPARPAQPRALASPDPRCSPRSRHGLRRGLAPVAGREPQAPLRHQRRCGVSRSLDQATAAHRQGPRRRL